MSITLYSCINSIVMTVLLLSFIRFIRKHYTFVNISEVQLFIKLYILCFIRLLFPIDFNFTIGISLKGIFSFLFELIIYKEFSFLNRSFTLLTCIIFCAFLISLFKVLAFIIHYFTLLESISKSIQWEYQLPDHILKKIEDIFGILPNCKIYKVPFVTTPLVIGILKKRILLPTTIYSDTELYYILLHEFTHLHNKDLFPKITLELISSFFWWIPFHTFIKSDIDQLIEIKCDKNVISKLDKKAQIEYMNTLISVIRSADSIDSKLPKASLSFAIRENHYAIVERFKLMTTSQASPYTLKNIVIFTCSTFLIICSYIFVPFPHFDAPNNEIIESGYAAVTSDNTYIKKEENDFYLITEDNISIPISQEHANHMLESGIKLKGEYDYEK